MESYLAEPSDCYCVHPRTLCSLLHGAFDRFPVFRENGHTLIRGLAGQPGKHEPTDLVFNPHLSLDGTITNPTVAGDYDQVLLTDNLQPEFILATPRDIGDCGVARIEHLGLLL